MTTFRVAFDASVDAASAERVMEILNARDGWASVGHSFLRVSRRSSPAPDAVWHFESDAALARRFPRADLRGLSVTVMSKPALVFINTDNWTRAPPGFAGSLARYREYLVQHEAGHAFLGLDHLGPRCEGDDRCPVMYQQSRGTRDCSPNASPTECDLRMGPAE